MRFTNIINKNKQFPPPYSEKYQLYRLLNILFGVVFCAAFIFLVYISKMNVGLIGQVSIILYFIINIFLILNSINTNQISIFLNLVLTQILFYNLLSEKIIFMPLYKDIITIDKLYIGILFFVIDLIIVLFLYYLNTIYPPPKIQKKH